jgi:hypothetical protein
MPLCKDIDSVASSNSPVFDKLIRQGTMVLYEGIYRCAGCGLEIAALGGKPMPKLVKRQHKPDCAGERWKLVVVAQ